MNEAAIALRQAVRNQWTEEAGRRHHFNDEDRMAVRSEVVSGPRGDGNVPAVVVGSGGEFRKRFYAAAGQLDAARSAAERAAPGVWCPSRVATTVARMARSAAFERFLAGVTAPVQLTKDSLDEIPNVNAILDLVGEERTEAEDILIAKLASGDGRAAAALAGAYCFRAIPALVEATSEPAAPAVRVAAARALLELGDHSGAPAMIRLLRTHEGTGFDRGAAARLLAEFPGPDREILFEVASTDPDPTARSEATHALLHLVGLDDGDVQAGEVLRNISGRLLSALPTVHTEAMAELREIIARWEAGESAEDLGLTWRCHTRAVRRFVDSIDSGKADFRTHGLEELTGRERTLVENLVLLRLDVDRRAVRAARTLGVHRAVEPLRELLASAEGHARAEIQSVLDTLTGIH